MSALIALIGFATVTKRHWVDGELTLELSDGSWAKVGFDTDYFHRLLWTSPDEHEDFTSCTAEQINLDPDVLSAICDEVERAVRSQVDDAGDAPKFSHADRMNGSGL